MPPGQKEPLTLSEIDFLKKHKLDSRFKSLDEAMAFIAEADKGVKERDTYKTQWQQLNDWAKSQGFGSFKELQDAAAASKKAPAGNKAAYRDTIAKKHQEFFGEETHKAILKEQPRLFEFLESIIEEALTPLRDNSEQKALLDKIIEAVDEGFDHRQEMDFLLSLPEAERAKVRPYLGELRKTYKNDKLYEKPPDAGDDWNPFALAHQRYLESLKKAGMKMDDNKRTDSAATPPRRIAFAGEPEGKAPVPGAGIFDEKKFIAENPDIQDENGNFNWAGAFNLAPDATDG